MLRDGGPSDVETARDVANRELLAGDEAKDLAASRLSEGGKCVHFLRVSPGLLSVKDTGDSPSPIHDAITTDPPFHSHSAGGNLHRQTFAGGNGEMATIAQDVARAQVRHWAARPLPEPPRSHRMSKSAPPQHDRIGLLLEDWMRELTVGNTLDGE